MVGDCLLVLGLTAFPAAGDSAGALQSETIKVSERKRSLALHLAAGIVLTVVGLEVMREALRSHGHGPPVVPEEGGVLSGGWHPQFAAVIAALRGAPCASP